MKFAIILFLSFIVTVFETTPIKAQIPQKVKNIHNTNEGINFLKELKGKLIFDAFDSLLGRELWISDGTEIGTFVLKDINPGLQSSFPRFLIKTDSLVFFSASSDQSSNGELYRTDGTDQGTFKIDLDSTSYSNPYAIGILGNQFIFSAYTSDEGYEIWSTNGDFNTTIRLSISISGAAYEKGNNVHKFNNELFFDYSDSINYWGLWKTDGTPSGTYSLLNYPHYSVMHCGGINFYSDDSLLFFQGCDSSTGREIWYMDKNYNFNILADLAAGQASSDPTFLGQVQDNILVTYKTTNTSSETKLMSINAKTLNRQFIMDLYESGKGFHPPNWINRIANNFYFISNQSMWITDGSVSGTFEIEQYGGYMSDLIAFQENLFFTRNDPNFGRELWKSNGELKNGRMIYEFVQGKVFIPPNDSVPKAGFPRKYTKVKNRLFFIANDDTGAEIYFLDSAYVGLQYNHYHQDQYINIWPNPSQNRFFAKLPQGSQNYIITIQNLNGFVLHSSEYFVDNGVIEVQHELKKGFYLVNFISGDRCYSSKLIVQ